MSETLRAGGLSAISLAMTLCAAPGSPVWALEQPRLDGGWATNRFVTGGIELTASDEIESPGASNLVGPYVFDLANPALFRIADGFTTGDSWEVLDAAVPILQTSPSEVDTKLPPSPYCTNGDQCWANALYGKAALVLGPGHHELSVRGDAAAGGPAHYFARIDSFACPQVSAPVIVAGNDEVILTFQGGGDARFSNDLYLDSPPGHHLTPLFNNHGSRVGDQVNLGRFPPGTELLFRLHVNDTGEDFFTGSAARNPDGLPHARVIDYLAGKQTRIDFEDLAGLPECPRANAYRDLSVAFDNVALVSPSPAEPLSQAATAQSVFPLDSFVLAKGKSAGLSAPLPRRLRLQDQFEQRRFALRKPNGLAVPAAVTGETRTDPAIALAAYPLADSRNKIGYRVAINNRLGPLQLTLQKASRLLVPSSFEPGQAPSAPDLAAHAVESFKCYGARITRGAAGLPKGLQLSVEDPLTGQTTLMDVTKATELCAPIIPDSGVVTNAATHLMCYRVSPAVPEAATVIASNALGAAALSDLRRSEICLPSFVAR